LVSAIETPVLAILGVIICKGVIILGGDFIFKKLLINIVNKYLLISKNLKPYQKIMFIEKLKIIYRFGAIFIDNEVLNLLFLNQK
jgi:hypothetical protein